MKQLLAIVMAGIFVLAFPAPAFSQWSPISTINPMSPVPNITCPPLPVGGWSYCNTLQQQIQSYNQYVQLANQVQSLRNTSMLYPQSLPAVLSSNLTQISSMIQRLENGDAAQRTATNPNVTGTAQASQFTAQQTQINNNLNQSVSAMLQQMSLVSQQQAADTSAVEQIKIASANAKSPAQVAQLQLQLLSILYNNSLEEESLQRQETRIVAEDILQHSAVDRQTQAASQATVNSLNSSTTVALPSPPSN